MIGSFLGIIAFQTPAIEVFSIYVIHISVVGNIRFFAY